MTEAELKNIHVESQTDSTVKISGEIPFSYLEAERGAAMKHLGAHMKVDGFREGRVPEKVVIERVGEMTVLNEMAERALQKAYPQIIETSGLEVIGYPQISITKIAAGNPLGFTAVVAVMPEITLPDYKKIASEQNKKKESAEVTDEEVAAQIAEILRQKAAYERLQKKAPSKEGETHTHEDGTVHEGPAHDQEESDIDLPIPELTDELVATLGQPGQFENVADFKAKIREHLEVQKKQDLEAKHRAAITDAIIGQTDVTLPTVMVEAEMNQMFAQMEEDLKRAGLTMESYLEHIKKSKDDLRGEWKPSAEKRAKLQLVLNEIAEKEHIDAPKGDVDHQVSQLLEQYKDANEARVRVYVESVLQNEAVMKMLESA